MFRPVRAALVALFLLLPLALAPPARADGLRYGGKMLLTNGVTSLEGAAGGGLTPWAVIAGNETKDGIGLSAHATGVEVKNFGYRSYGVAAGLFDRVEVSIARQRFDTNEAGALLGLGEDYTFKQDVFGAKLRLFGDAVYGSTMLPAVAIGAQYKNNHNRAIVRAIGARRDDGVDYYASATKLVLARSILVNITARMTKANQIGLLGFGGPKSDGYGIQIEGSAAWQLSRRLVIGGEYRRKPDRLGFAHESDWIDGFVAYAVTRHLTATMAYTDLGSIATRKNQRGVFASLQASF